MNRKKQLFYGLSMLLVVAFLTIGFECRSAAISHRRLKELSLQNTRVVQEVQRLRTLVGSNEKGEASLQKELAAEQSGADMAKRGPDLVAIRRSIRAWADLRYARLFKVLGLSMQQIAEFEDLATNHELAVHDISEAARTNGVAVTDPAVAQLLGQEAAEYGSREKDLVGDDGYQQLEDDTRTSEPRGWVNALAGNLYSSEPLSATQQDRLVQFLASQSPAYQAGSNADTKQIQNWDAVFSQAEGELTPAQLDAMKSIQATYPAGNSAVREALASVTK
jgi:hypothetical protein